MDKCTAAANEVNRVGCKTHSSNSNNHHGVCAICLNNIMLQETALIKGSEHAYCMTCILKWASCKKEPTCPQCKNPFEFLNVHRALDGRQEVDEETEEYYYDDEEEDLDDVYLGSSSSLRIGNRRRGDNGYVRGGRQQARPVYHQNLHDSSAGPSRWSEKKETAVKETVGRRAKRALKSEAADKAAVEKHQKYLLRLGRTQT